MDEEVMLLKKTCNYLLDEVLRLKNENAELNSWRKEIHKVLYGLQEAIGNEMSSIQVLNQELDNSIAVTKVLRDNLEYELTDPRKKELYFQPRILGEEKVIEEILKYKKSFARFGDGEFSIIAGLERQRFQRIDEKLAARLTEVLHSREENLLIGIANNYGCLDSYNYGAANAIRYYMSEETRAIHAELLEEDREYYDAYVSRPYVMRADNMTDAPRLRFERLKNIWKNRNVVIVEGALTRFGAGNDLMASASSIRRILGPATSSFDRYDEILAAASEAARDNDLYLIALGPCAGVLAYDLCRQGIQAIDVGHMDLEYEWFLAGRGTRVPVPHKYNNEYTGGDVVEEFHDELYESQVIARFL